MTSQMLPSAVPSSLAPPQQPGTVESASGAGRFDVVALWGRVRTWVREAYQRPGSPPHLLVLNLTVFMVVVALLLMVLESVPALEEAYAGPFFAAEAIITAAFVVDYAANIYTAPSKRGYILGVWGIIDLLAILPFFLRLGSWAGLRAGRTLRTLRALRALRVLKLARAVTADREAGLPEDEVSSSFWRDLQFGLIAACSVLVLVNMLGQWQGEELFWLGLGAVASANIALRRWLLQREQRALSLLLAFSGLMAGVAVALLLDADGYSGTATATALITTAVVTITAFVLEGSAGAL